MKYGCKCLVAAGAKHENCMQKKNFYSKMNFEGKYRIALEIKSEIWKAAGAKKKHEFVATYLVIDQLCMKIPGRVNKEFIAEVEVEQVVLEVIGVTRVDGQVTGVNDGLN